MKLRKDIWLQISWSNPYNFLRQWFNIAGWITTFYRALIRVCTLTQYGVANPKIVYYFCPGGYTSNLPNTFEIGNTKPAFRKALLLLINIGIYNPLKHIVSSHMLLTTLQQLLTQITWNINNM